MLISVDCVDVDAPADLFSWRGHSSHSQRQRLSTQRLGHRMSQKGFLPPLSCVSPTQRSPRSVASEEPPAEAEAEVRSEEVGWFKALVANPAFHVLDVQEWKDESWRSADSFKGRDLCHGRAAAVRVLDYVVLPATETKHMDVYGEFGEVTAVSSEAALYPQLVGPAYFTPRAESHRGLCHGGAFCSVMDDAVLWLGFCVSGSVIPWSGFTVQINTSLKLSVPVGSVLKLESWVRKREGRRKFWIDARLSDAETGAVYSEAQGLFLVSAQFLLQGHFLD
ncbi:hypothetical protein B484DRAFT_457449 [Ochromonadaceae sp. CCMP2298]|nr:hypothetical protein B484DRAFT_457449 [Ochromonadaceae sp. CCMP2298]